MELPQEIEVRYTIPAIRRELAQALVSSGLSQRIVAKKMDVTEAAVSQYLSNKRGTSFEYPQSLKDAINEAAKRIKNSDDVALVRREIMQLCEQMKNDKVICALHKKHSSAHDNCSSCYEE